jgi:glycine reductase
MSQTLRVVQFLNQFFGGVGGEEHADYPTSVEPGPVGPGRLLAERLGSAAEIVATVVAGDGYLVSADDATLDDLVQRVGEQRPDVFVAGPAFGSGRYGLNCGAVAALVADRLQIPTVTAMHAENPGVALYRSRVRILATAPTAAGMPAALDHLARVALRLGRGEELGPAEVEGYFPRGFRPTVATGQPAAERALAMLLARLGGAPYRTEIPIEPTEAVPPPPPVRDVARARLAVVTEGGIVPSNNPDRFGSSRVSKWVAYPIGGLDDLTDESHESIHGGFDTRWADEDPDRIVPLDALRALQNDGRVGSLVDQCYVTMGNGGQIATMTRIGQEIGQALQEQGVDAVVLTAT